MVSEYAWLKELTKVICFVPVYVEGVGGGNFTEVWMEDGRKYLVKKKIKTVLKNVASFLGVDIRQVYAAWAVEGRKYVRPLALGPYMTLVPVPVRRPRTRDEGATGYVVVQKVYSCSRVQKEEAPKGFQSVIQFEGGQKLFCLIKFERLAPRIQEGQNVRQQSQKLHEGLAREPLMEKPGTYMTIRVNKDTGEILVF
ncbi:hypothetical protein SAMN00808754_2224 [Thermanaeromonas toyohensis ToBE]|uniref:ComK protein n=1 Tax=Thermanaeromonas toyohensis ToBE TaxID=698762 RepID=A0A1W1VXZ4_9FIRM|nr:hypothetical protein [Thermanaeromonas toyohensis]SMB98247.1 hypothetical protein SAMN00808754_2224 [Thermanaeromonas toyohensis ToBE]